VDFPPTTLFHWIRPRKLVFNLSITSSEQTISAKQLLAVNLREDFDMVAAISAQGSHFETFAQLRDQFFSVKWRRLQTNQTQNRLKHTKCACAVE
jgi:hypothetical protein